MTERGVSDERKVYIVTSGVYSDYSINAVFSTLLLAEDFAEREANASSKWSARDVSIEEWLLDNPAVLYYGDPEQQHYLVRYVVHLTVGGDLEQMQEVELDSYRNDPHVIPAEGLTPDGSHYIALVWARDEQHAVKIANERRVRAIVEAEQGLPVR